MNLEEIELEYEKRLEEANKKFIKNIDSKREKAEEIYKKDLKQAREDFYKKTAEALKKQKNKKKKKKKKKDKKIEHFKAKKVNLKRGKFKNLKINLKLSFFYFWIKLKKLKERKIIRKISNIRHRIKAELRLAKEDLMNPVKRKGKKIKIKLRRIFEFIKTKAQIGLNFLKICGKSLKRFFTKKKKGKKEKKTEKTNEEKSKEDQNI